MGLIDACMCREASSYTQFIDTYYDVLPKRMIFAHDHETSWHLPVRSLCQPPALSFSVLVVEPGLQLALNRNGLLKTYAFLHLVAHYRPGLR